MKKSRLFLIALVAGALCACQELPFINLPGDNAKNYESIPIIQADTDGIVISIDSALAICKSLEANAVTSELYKLSGTLTVNSTAPADVPNKYTNINFMLSDNGGKTSITCYYTNNLNNRPFRKTGDVPLVGSKLTVLGPLTNYNGKAELKDGFIVRIDSMVVPQPVDTFEITCDQAPVVASQLPSGGSTNDIFIVTGYVQQAGYSDEVSRNQQTFWMDDKKDGKKVFEAYWCNVPQGQPVPVGAKVQVIGHITNYNNNIAEIKNGDVVILSLD